MFFRSFSLKVQALGVALIVFFIGAGAWKFGFIGKGSAHSGTQSSAPSYAATLELTAMDVITLAPQALVVGIDIAGNLKAAQSVWIKAKASGQVYGLTVKEGDVVTRGQVLGRIDPLEAQARLEQARQQTKSAQGQLQIAERAYKNNKALVEQGFISQTALENSSGSLLSAQANFRAAQAAEQLMQKGLSDTVLRSPMHGVVSQRLVQDMERVNVEARIMELVNLRNLELEAPLSTAESIHVKVGQSARLQVEGLPQTLLARVERISPSTQAGTRSILVYLRVPNPDANLRQGMFASGRLQIQRIETLAVPESSIRLDKPRPYIQMVKAGKIVHQVVVLGAKGELAQSPENAPQRWVQISEQPGSVQLEPGTPILTGAVGALPEGTQVSVAKAAS